LLDRERLVVALDLLEEYVLYLARAQMRFSARHRSVPVRANLSTARRRQLRIQQASPERYETPPERPVEDAVAVADNDPAKNSRFNADARDHRLAESLRELFGDLPLQLLIGLPGEGDL